MHNRYGQFCCNLCLILSLCVAVIGVPAAAEDPAAPDTPTLTIRIDEPGPQISRDIFGQFAEMLGEGIYGGVWVGSDSNIPNVRGIRSDVVAALKELKVPHVRWPGGCYGDKYHWRDGIGPASERRARINAHWGGVIEPNTFGTHEFMDFADQIGSEVFLSINVGSGTVAEAADWLEYMTADKPTALVKERVANGRKEPWKIKYLGIGNEPWGCGGAFAAKDYAKVMRPYIMFAESMHPDQRGSLGQAPMDPMLRIAGGEGLGKTEYTEELMKAWAARPPYGWSFEGLSLHYYSHTGDTPLVGPSMDFGEAEYADLMRTTYRMKEMIAEHGAIMDQYDPEKKVAMSIDEWGAWLQPLLGGEFWFLRQQNSIRDALAASINLNIFARHADRVRIANIAQMVNVIQSMILTDGPEMLLTPTYHTFRMYVPFQDATLIPLDYERGEYSFEDITVPRIDAIAAKDRDGAIWLAVTNIDPDNPAEFTVQGIASRAARGEVLTAPEVDAINTFALRDAVKPQNYEATASADGKLRLRLAPKSLTVVRLEE